MALEREQAFYKAHRDELRAKYSGKRIVIANDSVLGIYDSDREALQETVKTLSRGSFMVKYIPPDPGKEVIRILPLGNVTARNDCGFTREARQVARIPLSVPGSAAG